MIRIFKYTLLATPLLLQGVLMPVGAIILKVDQQGNRVTLWAWVDDSKPEETRRFNIFTTGEMLVEVEMRGYLGTVLLDEGKFVCHVFEVFK